MRRARNSDRQICRTWFYGLSLALAAMFGPSAVLVSLELGGEGSSQAHEVLDASTLKRRHCSATLGVEVRHNAAVSSARAHYASGSSASALLPTADGHRLPNGARAPMTC
jgi:hypothetical protein